MEWQPIETAPKDGTKCILFSDAPGSYSFFSPCEWSKAGEISEGGFWIWWQAAPEYLTEVKNPTHWMVLSKPQIEGGAE